MNLSRPHISCDGRFISKGEIITSIYLCPKYPICIPVCWNLERPCYISSPDLAWVPGMFRQRLWNKIPYERDVTRWVVSTEVYKATLGSFRNIRGEGTWQWQSMLQCLSQAMSLLLVLTSCPSVLLLQSSLIFWRDWGQRKEQELRAEHAWQ